MIKFVKLSDTARLEAQTGSITGKSTTLQLDSCTSDKKSKKFTLLHLFFAYCSLIVNGIMQLKSFLSGGFSKKMYAFQIYRYFDTAFVVAIVVNS